jgi:hypothetical protein
VSDLQNVPELRDKNGRHIERGDILKVFHFTGGRRKRHFMYKQAIGTKALNSNTVYMMFSHLEMDDQYYLEQCDGRCLADYEIVQSIDAKFQHRPRVASPSTPALADLDGEK